MKACEICRKKKKVKIIPVGGRPRAYCQQCRSKYNVGEFSIFNHIIPVLVNMPNEIDDKIEEVMRLENIDPEQNGKENTIIELILRGYYATKEKAKA